MREFGKTRRTTVLTAASLALAGSAALGLAGTATAATHPTRKLMTGAPLTGVAIHAGSQATPKHGFMTTSALPSDSTCWINVGLPGDYYYQGHRVGEIEQQYDICPDDSYYGTIGAHWQWDGAFQASQLGQGAVVKLYIGSPYLNGGAPWKAINAPVADKDVYFTSDVNHAWVNPDAWRAGAEVNNSGCVQWGSLHYYGDGSETDMPVGGCGPYYQVAPI